MLILGIGPSFRRKIVVTGLNGYKLDMLKCNIFYDLVVASLHWEGAFLTYYASCGHKSDMYHCSYEIFSQVPNQSYGCMVWC